MEKNVGFNIIDSPEWESVIEVNLHTEIQKKLNQWRHDYDLIILSCVPVVNPSAGGRSDTYLSLMRKKRV